MIHIALDTRQLDHYLAITAHKLGSHRVLSAVGQELASLSELSFQKQAAPDGTKWAKHAPATEKLRGMRGLGKLKKGGEAQKKRYAENVSQMKKLLDTGALVSSIQSRVEGNTAIVSVGRKYASIHQFGGQAGRGKKVTIPARPYLPITRDQKGLMPVAVTAVERLLLKMIEG